MSICRNCGAVGGYHYDGCRVPTTSEPTHRIEWTGNVQVHQPVRRAAA